MSATKFPGSNPSQQSTSTLKRKGGRPPSGCPDRCDCATHRYLREVRRDAGGAPRSTTDRYLREVVGAGEPAPKAGTRSVPRNRSGHDAALGEPESLELPLGGKLTPAALAKATREKVEDFERRSKEEHARRTAPRPAKDTISAATRAELVEACGMLAAGDAAGAWKVLRALLGFQDAPVPNTVEQMQAGGSRAEMEKELSWTVRQMGTHLAKASEQLSAIRPDRLNGKDQARFADATACVSAALDMADKAPLTKEADEEPDEEPDEGSEDEHCGAQLRPGTLCELALGHEGEHTCGGEHWVYTMRTSAADVERVARAAKEEDAPEARCAAVDPLTKLRCMLAHGHKLAHAAADDAAGKVEWGLCMELHPNGVDNCTLDRGHDGKHFAVVLEGNKKHKAEWPQENAAGAARARAESSSPGGTDEEAEYTPAPWTAVDRPKMAYVGVEAKNKVVAHVPYVKGEEGQAMADAALMAAAPELADFLVVLRGRLVTGKPMKPEEMETLAEEIVVLLGGAGVEVRS